MSPVSACKSPVSAHVSITAGGNTNPGDKWPVGVILTRVRSVTSQYWGQEGSLAFIAVTRTLITSCLTRTRQALSETQDEGIPHLARGRIWILQFILRLRQSRLTARVSNWNISLEIFAPGLWTDWDDPCFKLSCTEFKFSNLSAPNPLRGSSFKSSDWVIQHLFDYKEIAQKLNFWSKVRLIKENDECLLTRYLASISIHIS